MQINDEIEVINIEAGHLPEAYEIFRFLHGHTFFVDDVIGDQVCLFVTDKYSRIVWYWTSVNNVRKVGRK
jgi:hypothetical protein